jgi:hypothetical protein
MRTGNKGQIAQGSLLLSFALTLATTGFSQIPGVPSSEPTHEASPGHHEIPFQKYRDYLIVIQGSLGDTHRLNFIIDTGTDRTVIDSRVAQKLRIMGVVGRLAVHDQVVEVQQAVLPSLKIGALRATFLPVLIRDLAFLQKGLGIRIEAVIGLDVLQHRLHNKTDRFRGGAGLRFLGPISKCTALVDRADGSGWSFHSSAARHRSVWHYSFSESNS